MLSNIVNDLFLCFIDRFDAELVILAVLLKYTFPGIFYTVKSLFQFFYRLNPILGILFPLPLLLLFPTINSPSCLYDVLFVIEYAKLLLLFLLLLAFLLFGFLLRFINGGASILECQVDIYGIKEACNSNASSKF